MLKLADIIRPLQVSTRWQKGKPKDKGWSEQRIRQRVNQAARQGYHAESVYAKKKGLGLLAWLYGANGWLQHRLRASARNDLQGGQYDYSKYIVPDKPGDVVIAFAGARQGPGKGMDLKMKKRYGVNNYAIFRPGDVSQAIQYANKLPKGTRLFVQGHSHGGAAAAWFAQKYGKPIHRMLTYDPVGNFGKPQQKLKNVVQWKNAVAGDYREQNKYNALLSPVAKLGSDVSDILVDYMGRWRNINGAQNYDIPSAGHSDVQVMYKRMNKDLRDKIIKRVLSKRKEKQYLV